MGQESPMAVGKMGKGYFHALFIDDAERVKIVGFGKSERNMTLKKRGSSCLERMQNQKNPLLKRYGGDPSP